jgi:enediyne biosynthesis protein E4
MPFLVNAPPFRMSVMNRRRWLQNAATAALGYLLRPLPAAAPRWASKPEYFPRYVDLAKEADLLAKTIVVGHENKDFLLSTTGGGIALFDYDNDGWLDLFVVNGWGLKDFPKGQEPTNHLYKNNRNGTFTDVTEKAGLVRHGWGQGVCVGDYDNDGNLDLFVTYYGKNVLYHNNGNGTFTDATQECGLLQPEDHWNTGAAFVDYNRDGHLDLFVSNYVAYEHGLTLYESNPALVGQQSPILYGVAGLKGTSNILYRNNGNGTFTDVTKAAGISKAEPTYGFTPCVGDYDNDGWPDIYVADDSTPSLLFMNNHDGTFRETGILAGVAYDANGHAQGGMGADSVDYDGDGWLDLLKTNFSDEIPSLFHNEGKGFFTDVTIPAGLGAETSSVKWGTAFIDFDDDGRPDILIVSGFIYPPGSGQQHQLAKTDSKLILLRNLDGARFADISDHAGPAFADSRCSRGLACGDIFNTGRVDLVVNNLNNYPSLLRNQSPPSNSWLLVKLVGTKTNRAAIGSRVVVEADNRRQVQEVRSGGSFCSQNDLRLHFGLGAAKDARLRIRWQSGAEETLEHVAANRLIVVQEGKGIIAQESF